MIPRMGAALEGQSAETLRTAERLMSQVCHIFVIFCMGHFLHNMALVVRLH